MHMVGRGAQGEVTLGVVPKHVTYVVVTVGELQLAPSTTVAFGHEPGG